MRHTVSLKRNNDFRAIYARGKNSAGVCLAIYLRYTNKPATRLGITVSTKLGNAVMRNRARRRIREAYRLNEHRFRTGIDIIFVARSRTIKIPFTELQSEMLKTCAKLGALK